MWRRYKQWKGITLFAGLLLSGQLLTACSKQADPPAESSKNVIPVSKPKASASGGSAKMTEEPDAPPGTKMGIQGGLK